MAVNVFFRLLGRELRRLRCVFFHADRWRGVEHRLLGYVAVCPCGEVHL